MAGACGNSSVGRARPCQGRGRGSESRFPLHFPKGPSSPAGLFVFAVRPGGVGVHPHTEPAGGSRLRPIFRPGPSRRQKTWSRYSVSASFAVRPGGVGVHPHTEEDGRDERSPRPRFGRSATGGAPLAPSCIYATRGPARVIPRWGGATKREDSRHTARRVAVVSRHRPQRDHRGSRRSRRPTRRRSRRRALG